MDNRPIGVFDSGLGGITAIREIISVMPGEDIIYFGDTGRVPYGGRSTETILKYTLQDIRFLQSFSIKAILVACGTASTVVPLVGGEDGTPIVSVIAPAARRATEATRNGRIGIIATEASISSGAYERAIADLGAFETFGKSCPLFVPLVENGRTEPDDVVIETVAREYLEPLKNFGCDTLILGCTHYPLLKRVISAILPDVTLVDSGAEASKHLKSTLDRENALSERTTGGVEYYVSDDPRGFSRLASRFLGREVNAAATKVDIENY